MSYFIYFLLGLAPSFVWLIFYLRKDSRPEPKKTVLTVFLWGALTGPAAILLQLLARWFWRPTGQWPYFFASLGRHDFLFLLGIIVFAPLTEEYLKYLVVRWRVLKDPAFDEPFDAMLYLIISALGFAAVENLINILSLSNITFDKAVTQAAARFLSATLLHTLSSGILGYFLALSLLNFKKRHLFFWGGFLVAASLHSFYNFLSWLVDFNKLFILAMGLLLAVMAGVVSWQISSLKKKLAICKIK